MLRSFTVTVAVAGFLLQATGVSAYPGLTDVVIAQYPAATNLETCGTCHTSFTTAPGLNPYGQSFKDVSGGVPIPSETLAAIEQADSDGDGSTNIEEIDSGAGFFPGWTCETYTNAQNAPGNLADLVDPLDPGCSGATTTTSITTTTLPGTEACGQPISSGPTPRRRRRSSSASASPIC